LADFSLNKQHPSADKSPSATVSFVCQYSTEMNMSRHGASRAVTHEAIVGANVGATYCAMLWP